MLLQRINITRAVTSAIMCISKKRVVMLSDRLDMTVAVNWDV